jgi:eight-cysteine-cluster-containing protein
MTLKNSTIYLAMLVVSLVILSGCEELPEVPADLPVDIDKAYCEEDTDCVCGGRDIDGSCFLGNRLYYDAYVDKSEYCPDFCTGISGNIILKCVDNSCIQVYECLTSADCDSGEVCQYNVCVGSTRNLPREVDCTNDDECVTDGCSGTICRHEDAEPVFTTCEYRPEYACYQTDATCGCVNTNCQWKTLNTFDDCVVNARNIS